MSWLGMAIGWPLAGGRTLFEDSMSTLASIWASGESGTCTAIWSPSKSALKAVQTRGWIRDIADPRNRRWEEFYRNRWQHDKVVRSTHGVNCTGGCSWMGHVKDGIIKGELQATACPPLAGDLPPP